MELPFLFELRKAKEDRLEKEAKRIEKSMKEANDKKKEKNCFKRS